MRIDIQGLGFPLTAALLNHTERQLRFALTRTSARIKRVVVRLGNTNRPRGGEDKFCRMQVYLEHATPVLIEDSGADLYLVIDRAAVFIRPGNLPHADGLLAGLGCQLDASGFVTVDATGRTSTEGVWAAGNVVDPRAQVITSAGQGSAAAIAINLFEQTVNSRR